MKLHPIFSLKPIFETETYKRDMKQYFLHTDAKELLYIETALDHLGV